MENQSNNPYSYHPSEYESLKMVTSVLGICLFFIFCGILIILNGIKFIWKKP